ncbi:MAG TPA: fused MFS/spermidine synthase [Pirellulales bacterium]|jgi:hypothetical protein|nr:fused MFS/spermidine synthase [Pirellulales bacterium]
MTNGLSRRQLVWFYAATTFVSAFLLFQVQPIISKAILPWFGGSPAVWTTAMLFFQTLLFAGYAYAHFTQALRPRAQAVIHVALLLLAVAVYPILPGPSWKPPDGSDPAGRILLLLAVCVGLPYFVLSATGPLVQAWFARDYPGRSPYRLYSLSNVGSLLALLTYPFLIEPAFALGLQAAYWEIGFVVFGLLCGFLAVRAGIVGGPSTAWPAEQTLDEAARVQAEAGGLVVAAPPAPDAGNPYRSPDAAAIANQNASESAAGGERSPGWGRRLLWLVLPAFASLTFLATTNHVCQDVAVIPFLWIAPLSLYLLSFIICFDHARWYMPRLYAVMTLLMFLAGGFWTTRALWMPKVRLDPGNFDKIQIDAGLSFAGMFLICMLCHGQLVRLRPHPRHLTMFYLLIAAGGAVGGLLVSLVAPIVFQTGYTEWTIALLGGCVLAVAIMFGTEQNGFVRRYPWLFGPGLVLFAVALYIATLEGMSANSGVVDARRNFYGVVSVTAGSLEVDDEFEPVRYLLNGRIKHGMQFQNETLRDEPTTYYGRDSGVGRAIEYFGTRGTVRLGAIGLGTGTLAAYAAKNDRFTFYEINPQVPLVADKYFTYLGDARERMLHGSGQLEIVMGDARLSLERELTSEPSRGFQVLVVDAFSGDAIPTHLITGEAGEIYRRQLDPDGVLAIHISNRYLDLDPVVRGLADHLQFKVVRIDSQGDDDLGTSTADWMLLTRNAELLKTLGNFAAKPPARARSLLWTDEYSDLFDILK